MAHPEDRGAATCRTESTGAGEIAWITLEHAGKMNAMGSLMIDATSNILANLRDHQTLRVVVISGAGPHAFVGGAFVPELLSFNPEEASEFICRLHALYQALRDFPVPVIARVRGYCLGAGAELAAACDFRIADRSAVFGMPEVRVGMPSLIEAALLPMLVGWGKTREMLLTGASYSASEGREMGFFELVCHEGELDAAVRSRVDQILAGGPQAVRAQKALLRAWEDMRPRDAIESSIEWMARAYETGEPHRRLSAFIRK